ncbi:MAG: NAD(P)-binding protein [Planctomycetaceae bacterium]|nr:NAD(P)-binding protein [Planctomycetaceae bacterium]
MYDYLVVGAGLFGSVFARSMVDAGKKVLVVEKRNHVGGNIFDEPVDGIQVHKYGPHIFHTNRKELIGYLERFAELVPYRHSVKACYRGTIYSFPINLSTFQQLFGITTPDEARQYIEKKRIQIEEPKNFEESILSQVGETLYERFFQGYTQKHWGISPNRLPVEYSRRIPIRFNFNDGYFNDKYQFVAASYTQMIQNMLDGIPVELNCDFSTMRDWRKQAARCLYTGPLDELFERSLGTLDYVHVRFLHQQLKNCSDYQGIAVMNFTDSETPHTRITEHQHFQPAAKPTTGTIVTYEYPGSEGEKCYPISTEVNRDLYQQYVRMLPTDIIVGGRLGLFRYLDMDQTIEAAFELAHKETTK